MEEQKKKHRNFNPRAFNERDLAVIEQGLRLQLAGGSAPAEPEVIPPGDR